MSEKQTNRKLACKLALDLALAALLFLLYQKNAISLLFHEVAGLCAVGVVLIHALFLNARWVKGTLGRLGALRGRALAGFIVNALLLILLLAIGISGVMISKILFSFGTIGPIGPISVKQLHYFCSALALIVLGVHLGLHWPLIAGWTRRHLPALRRVPRAIPVCLLAVMLAFGAYTAYSGSFFRWIAAPFAESGGERARVAPRQDAPTTDEAAAQGETATERTFPSDGGATGKQRPGQGAASPWNALRTLIQYLCVASIPAAVTVALEKIFRKRRAKPAQA